MVRIIFTTLLTLFFINSNAQVNGIEYNLKLYKIKNDSILKSIELNENLKFDKKILEYHKAIEGLKETYLNNRKKEYLSKNILRKKRIKCVGVHVRKITECSYNIPIPNEGVHIKEEWIKIEGYKENIKVKVYNESINIKAFVNGKNSINTIARLNFEYQKDKVNKKINEEIEYIFNNLNK